ncbi:high-affinity choline transporter 1-like [Haemaphysalis longicornis]
MGGSDAQVEEVLQKAPRTVDGILEGTALRCSPSKSELVLYKRKDCGVMFCKKMRAQKPLTMLDPFQAHYGRWIAVPLSLPAVLGELFWTAANLAALGESVSIIADLNPALAIVASASTILLYTSVGGLISVVYTDVVQALTTFVGLVYFQQVLASDSKFAAQVLSYMSAAGCIIYAAPSIFIGATAKTSNFTVAKYAGRFDLEPADRKNVLPLSMHHLASGWASIGGQLAIVAAVMSSVDSSMLSASSLVAHNIYYCVARRTAYYHPIGH